MNERPAIQLSQPSLGEEEWLALRDPLASVMWASWVELSARDAAALGVHTGDWVLVRADGAAGEGATLEAGVVVSPAARPGVVYAPLGHGLRDGGRFARGRGVNLARLAGEARVAGTAAPALGELRLRLERLERPRQRLALYGRGLGAPEHLPRGWGAHDSNAPRASRPAGEPTETAPAPSKTEGASS